MNLLRKQQQNKRNKLKQTIFKWIGLVICLGAPILTYFVSGGEFHEADAGFVAILYLTLIIVGACVLAIDEVFWWLTICLYAALWIIMLISVPSANPERIMNDIETQMWLKETFAYSLAFALFVSGVFGLVIKFIIRQFRKPD